MGYLDSYNHISFDLDGTLVHTVAEYRHKIIPEVVRELGGHIKDAHFIDRFWFESGRDKIIQEGFNLNPAVFWKLFRARDDAKVRAAHTTAYSDAESALRKLKDLGKVTSIITGAPHWVAKMEIEKLNDAPHDFYLSLHDKGFGEKPDPRGMNYTLEQLHVTQEETLYIGNSDEDALFAKQAGVDFVYLERKEHVFEFKDFSVLAIHLLDELFNL